MPSIDKAPVNQTLFSDSLYFSSACRVGFRHLIKHLDFQGKKILLPGYIGISVNEGSGVYDPLDECQVETEFYRINPDLSIDIDDFKAKILAGNIKAVLVIHYFGILQSDIQLITSLCRKNHVLLIEDCAHTLTSTHDGIPLGEFGDFSIFSLHKVLPVSDGGMLRINNSGYFSLPPLDEPDQISLATLTAFCSARLDMISQVRRRNYQLLANHLSDVNEIEIMYPKLAEGIVPQNFPILIRDLSRERVYFDMIEQGVRVIALYYQLINQIDEQDHPIAFDISNRILNLPIHQDLTPKDIQFVADKLIEVIGSC